MMEQASGRELAVDPQRVISRLVNRVAQLEADLAVRDAAIEQLSEQLGAAQAPVGEDAPAPT